MVLLLLSLFTLMIRRLICLPKLLTANGLNSFAKTLVSSPWIASSFMHCFVLFYMFLFIYFSVLLYFVFLKKKKKLKNQKNTKTVCVCVHWYLCTLDGH